MNIITKKGKFIHSVLRSQFTYTFFFWGGMVVPSKGERQAGARAGPDADAGARAGPDAGALVMLLLSSLEYCMCMLIFDISQS